MTLTQKYTPAMAEKILHGSLPPVQAVEQLVDLEDYIYDLTGKYYNFTTLQDADTFCTSLDYYQDEGYSLQMAVLFSEQDMGL